MNSSDLEEDIGYHRGPQIF